MPLLEEPEIETYPISPLLSESLKPTYSELASILKKIEEMDKEATLEGEIKSVRFIPPRLRRQPRLKIKLIETEIND